MKPVEEARYTEKRPKWVEAEKDDIEVNKDGTVDVFAWGYLFPKCKVHESPSDRFEPETKYVIVEHPSGNVLRVWWV